MKLGPGKYYLIIATIIAVTGCSFYWFAWRPAKIRQDCSWVARHEDARPEIPAVPPNPSMELPVFKKNENDPFAELGFKWEYDRALEIIKGKPAVPAQPAKDWWEKADRSEYEFCIRSRGLQK